MKIKIKREKQGGFSDEVYRALAEYEPLCGYFSGDRTDRRDKKIEKLLRQEGLGPFGIACWLSSTSARHMMDDASYKSFVSAAAEYMKTAFQDVTVWSHPDLGGSMRLEKSSEQNSGNRVWQG